MPLHSPADAICHGIGMVHQHFTLVPSMTVAENVALGHRGHYNTRDSAARVRAAAAHMGLVLDPDARVEDLPVSAQQQLEIVKALSRNARLLILDEPTAVLAPSEVDRLLAWIRRYRDAGNSVVLITHKRREASSVADEVTILRKGRTVFDGPAAQFRETSLISAMIGSLPVVRSASRRERMSGRDVLVAHHVSVREPLGNLLLRNASLTIREGEIVGIAAIEGAGQHELLRVLAGRLAPLQGTVHAVADVAFIPEDRHRDALVLGMTLTENDALRGLSARRGRLA